MEVMVNNRKGQNVVEYILLVVAVVVVCIFFLRQNGPFKSAVEKSLDTTTQRIDKASSEIKFK